MFASIGSKCHVVHYKSERLEKAEDEAYISTVVIRSFWHHLTEKLHKYYPSAAPLKQFQGMYIWIPQHPGWKTMWWILARIKILYLFLGFDIWQEKPLTRRQKSTVPWGETIPCLSGDIKRLWWQSYAQLRLFRQLTKSLIGWFHLSDFGLINRCLLSVIIVVSCLIVVIRALCCLLTALGCLSTVVRCQLSVDCCVPYLLLKSICL